MRTISLLALEKVARTRPAGYSEEVISAGKIEGSFLLIEDELYDALRLKYSPAGAGDKLARILKPIARVIDSVAGTDLEHCPGCLDRREWLNRKFPFQGSK